MTPLPATQQRDTFMEANIPQIEPDSRRQRYKRYIRQYMPDREGSFIFSRLNIYYFTGTFANGVFWLPQEGEPILFCRRGSARAKIETDLKNIVDFKSYGDLEPVFIDSGVTVPERIACEMNGLSWSLAKSLTKNLPNADFSAADKLIAMTRAVKSDWELHIMRKAGAAHAHCLTDLLPPFLHAGISELQIAHKISELFYSRGHQGIIRMGTFGEETFLGHIAVGESANYPSVFNGPVGLVGIHPAAPFMGSGDIRWFPHTPLTIDTGFTLDGYQTDKTLIYWLGKASSIPGPVQSAHDFCVDMQAMIAEQLRPGVLPGEIWRLCEKMVADSPWNSNGFMGLNGNRVRFVGHGIGLAIDEYPVIAEGFDLPLEKGMVLAVEPKIGIRGVGMVGIENTFEVTPQGGKSLTGNNNDILLI